ncbi:MAG: hypothetical protein R3F59_38490 [Myxococcota bacterium]
MRRELLALLLTALLGCGRDHEGEGVSTKLRVQAKSGEVWGRDLANGLGLQPWELCTELGTSDCIEDAHRITLGGVDAAHLGIDEPVDDALVSAPIAVDRVAVSACGERFARDQHGTPVLFGPVLEEDSRKARQEVAENLVRRLLSRQPTHADVDDLLDLHAVLEPVSAKGALVRDWSVGACVVVATSTEALFY